MILFWTTQTTNPNLWSFNEYLLWFLFQLSNWEKKSFEQKRSLFSFSTPQSKENTRKKSEKKDLLFGGLIQSMFDPMRFVTNVELTKIGYNYLSFGNLLPLDSILVVDRLISRIDVWSKLRQMFSDNFHPWTFQ